ncbi:MAG: GIN domain-containing protein, partial [Bacteroidota bacterium]
QMELEGTGSQLNVELTGASKLSAADFKAKNVSVKAVGASKASVFASETLETEETLASKVEYKGNPRVTKD